MLTLKTLRNIFTLTALSSIGLCAVRDDKVEHIRDTAANENRSLTKDERNYTQNHSIPFYLAIGSLPSWLLVRQLDEKNQAKEKSERIIDFQI